MTEQKITPCLWFDFNAEEAVAHYLSIFPNGRILSTARYWGRFAGYVLAEPLHIVRQRDSETALDPPED